MLYANILGLFLYIINNKEGITITDTFLKILRESGRKPNKTWEQRQQFL